MIGQVLDGRYQLSRLLGRGGMGVVYLARQLDPAADVVVKLISPVLRHDREIAARFEREARWLSELQHANIVRYLGFGNDTDLRYLVMEYVDGEVLSDVLARKGRFGLEEFVPVAAQILKGVGYAHSRDVLLRDVKPSNIMLCVREGRANFVKLLDFGLAKVLAGEPTISAKQVLGTAGYIAPEVLRGADVDLRADVYALGVLAYLMLSGRQPFEAIHEAAIFSQTLHDEPPPLAGLLDSPIPAGLCELIHRCLEKDRERRPADANAMVEELIDVVPAALFRLPRVGRGSAELSSDSWSQRIAIVPDSTGRTPWPGHPTSGPIVSGAPTDELTAPGVQHPTPRAGGRSLGIASVALAAGLILGAVGWGVAGRWAAGDDDMQPSISSNLEPEPAPQLPGTEVPVAAVPEAVSVPAPASPIDLPAPSLDLPVMIDASSALPESAPSPARAKRKARPSSTRAAAPDSPAESQRASDPALLEPSKQRDDGLLPLE